jgi:hypothetical protein
LNDLGIKEWEIPFSRRDHVDLLYITFHGRDDPESAASLTLQCSHYLHVVDGLEAGCGLLIVSVFEGFVKCGVCGVVEREGAAARISGFIS